MRVVAPLAWVTTADLVAPVATMTGAREVRIGDWSSEGISGGAGDALGVWRVTGEATIDGIRQPFTIILKGWPPAGAHDPTAWDWPDRERRAYTSGMLDALPGGIGAPRSFGEVRRDDGSTWVWLSPMSTGALEQWALDDFATVARRLGRFNGAYLAGTPMPEAEWISRDWLRGWIESAAGAIATMERFADDPYYGRVCPPAIRDAIRVMWEERHAWLAFLDTLPRTFSHLDAFTRNTFLRPLPGGEPEIGLIDWGFAGIAALGEELGPLVAATVAFGGAPGIAPADLDREVFAGYLAGLRDTGWDGDPATIRAAYTGSATLRYALRPQRIFQETLPHPHAHPMLEEVFGMPIDALVDHLAWYQTWLLDLVDEFRALVRALAPLPSRVA